MDELLALMDNDVPKEETEISPTSIPENEEPQAQESIVIAAAPKSASTRAHHPDLDQSRAHTAVTEPQDRVEIGIDNKLGIRMLKRRMSSIDLMDLISTNPHHSPAALAAMSLASLNRLLVEPTSVVSAATVCGKTNIVTVGIVFSNSGTRISSNGRAFSVMTIGNLQTGPVASVFMFGEAYSKLCTKCPPGTVVALVSPNLLSPKENSRSETTVSLSVADPRQLLPVAQARDYGVCKGTVSAKGPNGQWISNGGQCKHHVDVRTSQYCQKHRKQQNVKNGPVHRNNGSKSMTFIQQQKAEHRPVTKNGNMTMQMPGGRTVVTHKPTPAPQSIMDELETFKSSTGRFQNAPMNKKKQLNPYQQQNNRNSRFQGASNTRQPPGRTNMSSGGMSSRSAAAARPKAGTSSMPVHEDWLNPNTSSRSSTTSKKTPLVGKKRAVNKDGGGYDGSVAVPKPSKIFRAQAPLPQRRVTPNQNTLTEAKMDAIRQQQRLVAERQKENSLLQGSTLKKQARGTRAGRPSADDALKDSLFGKLNSVDREEVMNSTSRFADEADAEAYARSRRIVSDLECREEERVKSKKKKQPEKESAIQKEWVCATCKRTTKTMPKLCQRSGHKISFTRSVRKSDTVQERRLKLDEKSVEDGGLKLGAGLEWDRRRFS